jgi:hypothetical protein
LAAVAAAMAVPACQALAKETRQVPIQPIGWLDYGGELYAKAQAASSNQSSLGVTTDQKESLFEEGVDVYGHGYVYHPNLLEWNLGLRAGAMQESISVDGNKADTNGTLLGYNASGSFFKEKPTSFRAYASENQSVRTRDFAPSTKLDDIRQGGQISTKGDFPGWLLVENLHTTEKGDQQDVDRKDLHWQASISDRRDPDWFTDFTYEGHDVQETSVFTNTGTSETLTQNLPDQSHGVIVSNAWRFGPGKRSAVTPKKDSNDQPAGQARDLFSPRTIGAGKKDTNQKPATQPASQPAGQDDEKERSSLAGRVIALDRTGTFPDKELSIDERLELVHSKTFLTFYEGTFDYDQTDVQTDRYITGDVGFQKKIYDSLDITVKGTGRDRDYGNGTLQSEGGSFQAAYRKTTPVGLYSSSLLVGAERDEQQSSNGQRFVQNERVTLTGLAYSRLSLPNVVAGSVAVTDPNGLPYFLNVDYFLRTTGAFTEIARAGGGNIPDGKTVRVDYRVVTGTQAVWNTDRFDWANRLALKGLPLALYANFLLDDENFQSGVNPGNLDKIRDLLLGTELSWEGLVLAVEHETNDQILSPPFTANRGRATYSRPLGRSLDLSLNALIEKLVYEQARQFGLLPGQDFLDTLGAGAALTAKLNPNTLVRFQSDLAETKGRENRTLLRNSVTLEWISGKLTICVEARYDTYEQEQTTGTAAALLLSAKRRF